MISGSNTPLKHGHPKPAGTGLASPPMADSVVADHARSVTGPPRGSLQLWVHRLSVLLFVFVCATVGVLLVILPWHSEWTDNRWLLSHPDLRSFVAHGFVRGICSGLGLLDIWIGFWEAIHYRE